MSNESNITCHEHKVTRSYRVSLNSHKGCVIWYTGMSGSGMSTIANALDHTLHQWGMHSVVLDGDNVRHSLNPGPSMLMESHGEQCAQRFGLWFSAIDCEEYPAHRGSCPAVLSGRHDNMNITSHTVWF